MANYTMELYKLLEWKFKKKDENDNEYIDHDALFPNYSITDEAYKSTLQGKIISHFYTREIGQETPDAFIMVFRRTFLENLPKWNNTHEAMRIDFAANRDVNARRIHTNTYEDEFTGAVTGTGTSTDSDAGNRQGKTSHIGTGTGAETTASTGNKSGTREGELTRTNNASTRVEGVGSEAATSSSVANADREATNSGTKNYTTRKEAAGSEASEQSSSSSGANRGTSNSGTTNASSSTTISADNEARDQHIDDDTDNGQNRVHEDTPYTGLNGIGNNGAYAAGVNPGSPYATTRGFDKAHTDYNRDEEDAATKTASGSTSASSTGTSEGATTGHDERNDITSANREHSDSDVTDERGLDITTVDDANVTTQAESSAKEKSDTTVTDNRGLAIDIDNATTGEQAIDSGTKSTATTSTDDEASEGRDGSVRSSTSSNAQNTLNATKKRDDGTTTEQTQLQIENARALADLYLDADLEMLDALDECFMQVF